MNPIPMPLAAFCVGAICLALLPDTTRAQAEDPFQPPSSNASEGSRDKRSGSTPTSEASSKEPERVVKTLEQWQKQLTHEQFMVTRMKATEAAFSGKYAHGHWQGTFLCVCCGAKLFEARHKFESGTGWPSFDRPVSNRALETAWDYSEAEARVEVTCRRCGAHLGHVFQDGPTSTGLRYCMNSLALKLDSEKEKASTASTRKSTRTKTSRTTARRGLKPSASTAPSAEKSAGEESSKSPS